jgi:hypothetical protein
MVWVCESAHGVTCAGSIGMSSLELLSPYYNHLPTDANLADNCWGGISIPILKGIVVFLRPFVYTRINLDLPVLYHPACLVAEIYMDCMSLFGLTGQAD